MKKKMTAEFILAGNTLRTALYSFNNCGKHGDQTELPRLRAELRSAEAAYYAIHPALLAAAARA